MNIITPNNLSKKKNNKQKELAMLIDLTFFESNEVYGLLAETGTYEAFGIYTAIFVSLRRLENRRLKKSDLKAFAFRLHIDLALLEKTLVQLVNNGLLAFEDDQYYSPYLDRVLAQYLELSQKCSEGGKKGAEIKASKRALSEGQAPLKPPMSPLDSRLEPPFKGSNLIQSNLKQSNTIESKKIESKIEISAKELNASLAPESDLTYELSEKAKKFASKLKIDLAPKSAPEPEKPTMTEDLEPSENERNHSEKPDEIEKTTETIAPPVENGLMAKFGSFELPEDLQKFSKAVEAELDVPDGSKKWEISSQFILAGRRPVKKYLDIWFSPIELAQVAAEYERNGVLKEMKTALRLVQTRLDDLKAQNKNHEFRAFTGWMLGFVLNDLLDKKIKKNILDKQEARK